MTYQVANTDLANVSANWLVVGVLQDARFGTAETALDERLGGTLSRLKAAEDVTGKQAEICILPDVPQIAANRLLLVGLGTAASVNMATLLKALQSALRKISDKPDVTVGISLPQAVCSQLGWETTLAAIGVAANIAGQGPGLYQKEAKRFPFKDVTVLLSAQENPVAQGSQAIKKLERGVVIGDSVNITRELVNRPANDIFPIAVAEFSKKVAADHGLECEVLDQSRLEAERMGSLLAVAKGSDQPPCVVVLRYKGAADPSAPTLALIGKGVTFDSGGLSLKPSESMKDMKCDMAGAATVLGAMAAIAQLKIPVNVVGYMGLVENMISGRSYRLGDVLTARNGTTIEVLNTDAEGRLVLADVLSYAVDQKADYLVDLATLTGACVVALGEEIVGAFSNHQAWCSEVLTAAASVNEDVWQMPMFDSFNEQLKSDVADCKNVGTRWGGAITAAKFLEKFVNDVPWVHLDIAGPSFATSGNASRDSGATGCMVRTLVALAERFSAQQH